MDVRSALKGQYCAALGMLRQTIERCPEPVWLSGEHPRTYWRIAYHALFYTHLYLQPDLESFVPWSGHRADSNHIEALPWPPHAEPPACEPYARGDVLAYLDELTGMIGHGVDALDLDAPSCGFHWYHMPKLDHQMMNIRHIQQHAGQLAERLYAVGVELDWIGTASAA